jgi:hypothetical protein
MLFEVFQAAGVLAFLVAGGSGHQAVEAHKAGQLQPMAGARVQARADTGAGSRRLGMGHGG